LAALLDHLKVRAEDKDAQRWLALIQGAYDVAQVPGGMSGWGNRNDSQNIEVLQAEFDEDSHMTKVWEPGVRNAVWNPLGIRFFTSPTEWSERRFMGIYTLASSPSVYVGYNKDWKQIIVYHLVDEKEKV
jgi:hypothetical protein